MLGYYVHHHGEGHRTRAARLAAELDDDVVALTSLPRPADLAPFHDWVQLARDDEDATARAHDAGGALHWAPLDAPGYRARMHRLASWLANARPDAVVVDVSVEVTTLCRLLGVPVAVVAGAGRRDDDAHRLAYRLADAVIAPWNGALYRPAHLAAVDDRTCYAGALSRFDHCPPVPPPGRRQVLALFGSGGAAVTPEQVARAREATPGWTWRVHGLPGTPWTADVWDALCGADVVVTHAGMNGLAETAAARRPAVVLPQPRPFDEQAETGAVLAGHGLATVRTGWPAPDEWPGLLAAAAASDPQRWSLWNDGGAAARAARAIEKIRVRTDA